MTSRPTRTIASALLLAICALACCFSAGSSTMDQRSVVSTRDVPLGSHGSLRVYGVLTNDHVDTGQSGFGCFGAPYPTFRWETAQPASDTFYPALAVQPGDQAGPPATATMLMVTTSRDGSFSDRDAAIASLAPHDVVACTDDAGTVAVVWGLVSGTANDGDFTLIGLEPGSTLARTFDLADYQDTVPFPPESATWQPDAQCAWFLAHRDLYLAIQ